MKRLLIAVGLACLTATTGAAPIVFTSVDLSTATLAIAAAAVESANDSSAVTAPPLLTTSSASDTGATATATAIADQDTASGVFTLAAVAEALGGDDGIAGSTGVPASALASASFLGQFLTEGDWVQLAFDFEGGTDSSGNGTVDALAHVTFIAGTDTLIDEVLRGVMSLSRTFLLPAGLVGLLSIETVGTADAPGAFDLAAGRSSLTFTANRIPEPAGWALMLLALFAAFLASPPALRARGEDAREDR